MKFEIVSNEVNERKVTSKKDGKEYTFYTQEAYLHDGSTYPTRCFVPVAGADAAYNLGWYTLAPGSLFVDRFANVVLHRRYALVRDET